VRPGRHATPAVARAPRSEERGLLASRSGRCRSHQAPRRAPGSRPNPSRRWLTRITDRCPTEKVWEWSQGLLGLTNRSIPFKSDTYRDSSIPPLPALRQSRTSAVQPLRISAALTPTRRHTTNPVARPDPAAYQPSRFRDGADRAPETNAREPIQGFRRRPTAVWLGERGNTHPSLLPPNARRPRWNLGWDRLPPRARLPVCAIRRRGSFCGFKKLPPRSTP
jgi:hypothetical protein